MSKKVMVVIVVQALIIVALAWVLVFYGKDEFETAQRKGDEEISAPSRVSQANGATVVSLSAASQKASGLVAEPLKSANFQTEQLSYGSVVGVEALADLRARYLAALADANVVRAAIANSEHDYQRMLALNKDNRNVSDRAVQSAEAAWKADQARLVAAETTASGIRDSIRQQWGDVIARWVTGGGLSRLLAHEQVLLQIALPADDMQPEKIAHITVTAAGGQGKPVVASYVSPSPQTDSTIQGRTYYFFAPAKELRAGMRVEAHLQLAGKANAGIIVPNTAVVWYAGKAWVYKQDGEKFTRLPVSVTQSMNDGWFNGMGFAVGDLIVTNGAQLLLSEELKYQIKNENED
ncbi:MAG: efflux RND transporter periplasmic adaptor subunit [Methylophilaceae bacterium]